MKFKKDEEGQLMLDDNGDPIAVSSSGEVIPLDKVVSLVKYERVVSERDEALKARESAEKTALDNAKTAEEKAAIEKQFADERAAHEAEKAEWEKTAAAERRDSAITAALLGAGVPQGRLKAAKALVDSDAVKLEDGKLSGLDIDSFKTDHDYLFAATQTVEVGGAPAGPVGASVADSIRAGVEAEMKKE